MRTSNMLGLVCLLATSWPAGAAEPAGQPRLDAYGDPLPAGALVRLGTVRLRHAGWSPAVLFSADGKTLITGSEDGKVSLSEPGTGKPLQQWRVADGGLQAMALSPDGKTLAAGGYQGITLWD